MYQPSINTTILHITKRAELLLKRLLYLPLHLSRNDFIPSVFFANQSQRNSAAAQGEDQPSRVAAKEMVKMAIV